MISFITIGRDDNYGGEFLDRLYTSISKNIENIELLQIPYEYIVVEWSPDKEYLIHHSKFKELFITKNLIDVIVKSNVAISEGLEPTRFYEYFAKNVGVRNAGFDVLLILNADIVIPYQSMKIINDLVINSMDDKKYYRLLNRVQTNSCELNEIDRLDISSRYPFDAHICGYCAGDFLLITKKNFIEYGEGYDETNLKHRTVSQTSMDGEIMWNLYYKGLTLQYLNGDFWHINHGRGENHSYDGEYNSNGYRNKPNWGFIDYPKKMIIEKLIEIG